MIGSSIGARRRATFSWAKCIPPLCRAEHEASSTALGRCSIARALSVVGDRWTLLLLREAFLGSQRFEEFHDNTGAARQIVSARLNHLIEHGVPEKAQYSDRPVRFEYSLTSKGNDLYPVTMSLLAWGDRWMIDGRDPSLAVVHEPCGATMTPELRCPSCQRNVEVKETRHVVAGRGRRGTR